MVFKEDALKAGAEAIETLKGLKGKKLENYMKQHFDTAWSYVDTNQDGDVGFD